MTAYTFYFVLRYLNFFSSLPLCVTIIINCYFVITFKLVATELNVFVLVHCTCAILLVFSVTTIGILMHTYKCCSISYPRAARVTIRYKKRKEKRKKRSSKTHHLVDNKWYCILNDGHQNSTLFRI